MRRRYIIFILLISIFLTKTNKDFALKLSNDQFLDDKKNIEKYFIENRNLGNIQLKDPNYYYLFARYLLEKKGFCLETDFLFKKAVTTDNIFKDDAVRFYINYYIKNSFWISLKDFINNYKKYLDKTDYQFFISYAENNSLDSVDKIDYDKNSFPLLYELVKTNPDLFKDNKNKLKIDDYMVNSEIYSNKDREFIDNLGQIAKVVKNDFFLWAIYSYKKRDVSTFLRSVQQVFADSENITDQKMQIIKKFSIDLGLRKNFYNLLSIYYSKNKILSYYYAFEILNFENFGKYQGFLQKIPVCNEINQLNHEIRYKSLYYSLNYSEKWLNNFVDFFNDYPDYYKSNLLLYIIFKDAVTRKNGKYFIPFFEKIKTDNLNPLHKYQYYYYMYLLDENKTKWQDILLREFPAAFPSLKFTDGRILNENNANTNFILPKKSELSVEALVKLAKTNYLLEFSYYDDAMNIDIENLTDKEKAVIMNEIYLYNIKIKDYYTALNNACYIADLIFPEGIYSVCDSEYLKRIYPMHYKDLILKYSQAFNIDPALAFAVMREESFFKYNIVSYQNAVGLMQIMPPTGRFIANKLKIKKFNLYNPEDNIKMGVYYLKFLTGYFTDNEMLLSCYNAGQGNTLYWHRNLNKYPKDILCELIPVDETRYYIKKVMNSYYIYKFLLEKEKTTLTANSSLNDDSIN